MSISATSIRTYQNYLNGRWEDSSSGESFDNINPADCEEVIGRFPQSTAEDVNRAVGAAECAYSTWRNMPPAERAKILQRAIALMEDEQDSLARDLTKENGKTLAESRAEILAARKEMAFQVEEGRRHFGKSVPSEQKGVLCFSVRQPLGVVGIITPWNFPFNVVCRKATPALMAGNCVVFKPASFTPLVAVRLTKILQECGLPPGVFNLIIGQGGTIGDTFVQHPSLKAISFTGSTRVGRSIEKKALTRGTKVQAEMGGKNPAVVLEDANLDQAADDIVRSAYACAGQWCTSTSRVIALRPIFRPLLERIIARTNDVIVGNGMDSETTMGPVAGLTQMDSILNHINLGRKEGATLVVGGERYTDRGCERRAFVAPTVFTDVQPQMRIAQEEIFGPVLCMMEADNFDEAVEMANNVSYGLSSSVFTNSLARAFEFVERTAVGLTHVNLPTAYKEVSLEFGGIKESGAGLPEGGSSGIDFFTEHKVAYIKYQN